MNAGSRQLAQDVAHATDAVNKRRRGSRAFLLEGLEPRVLMSAAHHPVHAAALALLAPQSLSATATAPTSVSLAWTDGDDLAAGFLVLRSADGVHFSPLAKLTSPAAVTYTDSIALSFHTYSYEVEEVNGAAASLPSSPASASTPLKTPVAPAANPTGPTNIQLSWTSNEPSATGYNILRSTDGINFTSIATIGKVTKYIDATVLSGTQYTYELQAMNGSNVSAVSKTTVVSTPLFAPSGLAWTFTGGSVALTWTDNDAKATGYYVLRSANDVTFAQIGKLTAATANAFADSNVMTGHTYYYKVQAVPGATIAATSAALTVNTPLTAPSGLSATAAGANNVTLSWTDNDANAQGYIIERGTDGVHFTPIAKVVGASLATYSDKTAVSGTAYDYEVIAYANLITSSPTAMASATTPLAAPATLAALALGPTSVKLTWPMTDPLATGYAIFRSTDGINFSPLANVTGRTNLTYADTAVSSATTYVYEVQATGGANASAVSKTAAVTTPLFAPTRLAAAITGSTINLAWTDNDNAAAGYYIMRSVDGKAFTQLAYLTNGAADSYNDASVLTGNAYAYEVQAYDGSITSIASAAATISVPLAAPSNLTAANGASGVALAWSDNDANALGYTVLRSTDGIHFTSLAALTGTAVASYIDSKALSDTSYTYEVEADAGAVNSAPSAAATVTAPLATPTTLTATLAGAYVTLSWIDKDSSAAGYAILRSTDDSTFSPLTTLSGAAADSFVDTTVSSGTTYYYQVQATTASNISAVSNTASVAVPEGNASDEVSVSTRYGDELVVTAAGASDSVSITESSGTITIIGDGQTFTDPAPVAGLFVYTRGGNDSIIIGQSVTERTTVDSIDNANTVINTSGSNVSVWDDSIDTVIGSATIHSVASFAGGVSKALGASLANPKDAGTTAKQNLSLFGAGPVAADVNQGSVGDCYLLSSLAAFANQDPQVIQNSAVDLGDGTYAVEFQSAGKPVYVRVNNSFTVGGFGGFLYAHPGANNTIWAAVMEKAFAYFRTGANTYASINSGWMGEVYTDLGFNSTTISPGAFSDTTLYNMLSTDLDDGQAVTFGTDNAPNLVSDHAYTLIGVSHVNGVNMYTVRNPWGVKGDSLENSSGIATLTYAQFIANFVDGAIASA